MWETMRLSKLLSWGVMSGRWWFSKVILLLRAGEMKGEIICGTEWLAIREVSRVRDRAEAVGVMSTSENHCKSFMNLLMRNMREDGEEGG